MPATFALSDEAELPPSSSPNGSVMLGECETHRYSVSTLDLYRKNLRHLGDYEIVSYLVDTGAQTTISKPGVLYLMLRQQKSSLAFSGFHGNARTYSLMRGEFDGSSSFISYRSTRTSLHSDRKRSVTITHNKFGWNLFNSVPYRRNPASTHAFAYLNYMVLYNSQGAKRCCRLPQLPNVVHHFCSVSSIA